MDSRLARATVYGTRDFRQSMSAEWTSMAPQVMLHSTGPLTARPTASALLSAETRRSGEKCTRFNLRSNQPASSVGMASTKEGLM